MLCLRERTPRMLRLRFLRQARFRNAVGLLLQGGDEVEHGELYLEKATRR
jgi:hypothetical protein